MSPKRINLSREAKLHEISGIIGHEFRDLGLLHRALSHSSLGNEGLPDYERLEFLGDAVLGFLVAESLYKRKPEVPEGELTSRRSLMVSRRPLATVAEELNLGTYLLVGRGLTDESLRSPRILADLVEAVLAAIYLDGGIRAARRFVEVFVIERFRLDQKDLRGTTDPKTRLNQWAQAQDLGTPHYEIIEATGPDHDPTFRVAVTLDGITCRSSEVKSKQTGEQEAAAACLADLRATADDQPPGEPTTTEDSSDDDIQIIWEEAQSVEKQSARSRRAR